MKRKVFIFFDIVILLFLLISYSFAETITLKSGRTVKGKVIEKTNKYVKIDFQGVSLTYFLDEIENIDGEKTASPLPDKNITINVTFDNPNTAIGYYEAAIKQNPDDFSAHNSLGMAYAQLNQFQKAIESFQKAIEINPNFAESYAYLGAAYNSLQQPEKAITYLEKATELGSVDIRTYASLGGSYYFTGKFFEAILYFEKVVQLDPKNIKAYIALGSAYKTVGKYQKAREKFLKLEELYKEQGDYQAVQEVEELLKGISNVSAGSD